ncbi:DUF4860 domain-containing protein [Bacilliculturomica massiliensis]|uniref:DUF4860 domain-containing protein n=1 Tax=Bacilliculturomica massiliensis TaxID=1917867 RepID=UPI0013EF126D|nr:DUF4860 domain-containing protein [Bacilliculturomica massiliensis]
MDSRINNQRRKEYRSPDTLCILLLLCVFAFSALMMAVFGANAYTRISTQKELHFQRTTPLFYIAGKVRQTGAPAAVRQDQCGGVPALVFTSDDGGEPCETWIYEYDGSLYELYIDAGAEFEPADGTPILDSDGLSFHLDGGRLTLTAAGQNGQRSEMTLTLRGGEADE